MNCATKGKVLGAIRIIVWLMMLAFGIMKFGAPMEMKEMVGGAWAALGLDFLSTMTWFWLAVAGEIVAWLLLLSGCKKLVKVGAVLALIIMVFAINATGFDPKALVVVIGSLAVLAMWPGCWTLCKMPCCKGGACCTKDGTCDMEQQQ